MYSYGKTKEADEYRYQAKRSQAAVYKTLPHVALVSPSRCVQKEHKLTYYVLWVKVKALFICSSYILCVCVCLEGGRGGGGVVRGN